MDIHSVYGLFLPRFRRRRMKLFERLFGPTAATTILDVGGEEYKWTLISSQPKVMLINTYYGRGARIGSFQRISGDGRKLPFADKAFDVVYSNSVIEHVGSAEDQAAFADEVRRVGRAYFVQTPDWSFPVEPHFLMPFFHYFPVGFRKKAARHFTPWGLIAKPDEKTAEKTVESIRLLTEKKMGELFFDGRIVKERFCGLSKSLIAIKDR